jgi:NAD(P)-dependent dehydrogenase (short-subunit alcohol dehydrogenase family)
MMPPSEAGRSVVITGVSSGIGWGTTKILVQKGFKVFGSVRRPADAERLQREFGSAFEPLLFDVTDVPAVEQAAESVRERLQGKTLYGLVNNAGIAIGGPLLFQPLAEFRQHLEVNLVGMLTTIQKFGPLLKKASSGKGRPGRIVNVGSVSDRVAAPFLGAYTASKFAIEGFTDCLRRELMPFGIDVIVVRPGAVATAIWDKAQAMRSHELEHYQGTGYEKPLQAYMDVFVKQAQKEGLPPETVGRAIYRALTAAKPQLHYNVIPNVMRNWVAPNLMPSRWLDLYFGEQLGLIPKKKKKA